MEETIGKPSNRVENIVFNVGGGKQVDNDDGYQFLKTGLPYFPDFNHT